MSDQDAETPSPTSPEAFFDRELSWLAFARRVLAQVEDADLPLFERVKFAGIMGMLHDEFFMKRMAKLNLKIRRGSDKLSLDGKTAAEQKERCRGEIREQLDSLAKVLRQVILPSLAAEGLPIRDYRELDEAGRRDLRLYFERSVLPILTPLAVDSEHPFPFISNDSLNLAIVVPAQAGRRERFIRLKVPDNRARWVRLPGGRGVAPLEQVIAANLDLLIPSEEPVRVYFFRVTRGAQSESTDTRDLTHREALEEPGSIIEQVSGELRARRFAGVSRLEVGTEMPAHRVEWMARQLEIDPEDVYRSDAPLGLRHFLDLRAPERPDLYLPPHRPVVHRRMRQLAATPEAVFDEIRRGDVFVHHPYQSFDSSVLRFLESAAIDPKVLAIKLTIYRTSKDSPIVQALAEASRQGKQVAVLVEITARFDEAPNIAWGKYLEKEGVHVAYGVEKLKTHVKAALVVREEEGGIRRYAHLGTGNYHTGTARIYEDLGILTCHPEICAEVAAVFNELSGAVRRSEYQRLLVAPVNMRDRFLELIGREAEHAEAGRESGIRAKMNQLQDPETIRQLYAASRAGVPIELFVRGLCCLRPGVPGLSENIRVSGVIGRFLEHSRIYRFANDGDPEIFIGSADWMVRNLSKRVETITPVLDPAVRKKLEDVLEVYATDNCSAWDCRPDGSYVRRQPEPGEERRAAQEIFARRAAADQKVEPGEERDESAEDLRLAVADLQ